jgi:hypothetical protein
LWNSTIKTQVCPERIGKKGRIHDNLVGGRKRGGLYTGKVFLSFFGFDAVQLVESGQATMDYLTSPLPQGTLLYF